ncbi:MAG TPA: flagellar assembly protein FliW [Solirubrobacteraceae bacterium]|nr:flagellar assembly protein FliW [Solirubrobacteraceae bacterium]
MTVVTFESVRFGTIEVDEQAVIEFPLGLIGLGGTRYTLLDRNPGSGFQWLHCIEDPALALPVVSPTLFFSSFALQLSEEDRERTGIEDVTEADVYVTVRAAPDPHEITANLRAPLLVRDGRGHQVLNFAPGAELRAALFEPDPLRIAS